MTKLEFLLGRVAKNLLGSVTGIPGKAEFFEKYELGLMGYLETCKRFMHSKGLFVGLIENGQYLIHASTLKEARTNLKELLQQRNETEYSNITLVKV